jgi:hypothetical protein
MSFMKGRDRGLVATLAVSIALAGLVGGGCGGSNRAEPPPPAGAGAPGAPALLKKELAPGEIRVEGEYSPGSHGPFRLSGRYAVRFAQYAPEAPGRGFADQTPFVAELRDAAKPRRQPLRLCHDAAGRGARTIPLDGRYLVEVPFGDFPYVIVFTPLR